MSTASRPGGSDSDGHRADKDADSPASAASGTPPWQRGSAGASASGAVDAPTTQLTRPSLPADMPDLSAASRTSADRGAARGAGHSDSARGAGGRASTERRSASARTDRSSDTTASVGRKGPRRASLQVKHVDPWSVLKLSLVLSFALFLVWMVAVGVLYLMLDGMGVWERLNTTFTDFVSVNDPNARSAPLIGPGRVFGAAAIIGAINIVLLTAVATISSFIYNLTSDLVGGVEVTLTERD